MKINSYALYVILINISTCYSYCESSNDEIFIDFSIKFCTFRRRSHIDVFSDEIISKGCRFHI